MILTTQEISELEKLIQEAMNNIAPQIRLLKNPNSPMYPHIENVNDFVLGQMQGWVFGGFAEFMTKRGKLPTKETMDEVFEVMLNRIQNMKKAITDNS